MVPLGAAQRIQNNLLIGSNHVLYAPGKNRKNDIFAPSSLKKKNTFPERIFRQLFPYFGMRILKVRNSKRNSTAI